MPPRSLACFTRWRAGWDRPRTRSAPTTASGRPRCSWPSPSAMTRAASGLSSRSGAEPPKAQPDESTRFRSGALSLSAWLARSTTPSMFCLALPALTLTIGFPNLRFLYRTTLAFRPHQATDLAVRRGAGRCRTLRSRSVGHGCGGGRFCCRPSSVAAAAVSACPCRGRGCPQCRGGRAPGVRQAT
jgi:hypothetical protein